MFSHVSRAAMLPLIVTSLALIVATPAWSQTISTATTSLSANASAVTNQKSDLAANAALQYWLAFSQLPPTAQGA